MPSVLKVQVMKEEDEENVDSQPAPSVPTLLDHILEMMQVSLLIYGIADLRELARQPNKLPPHIAEDILKTPVSAEGIQETLDEYVPILREAYGEERLSLYLNSNPDVRRLLRRKKAAKSSPKQFEEENAAVPSSPLSATDSKILSAFDTATIEFFNDENCATEPVYALGVNQYVV